ncbi:phosphoadenosine phosphosulfate reductase domain-containing protein [Methylobacterium sp. A54F]
MIAALATALSWSYERVAEALGYPCNPTTGLPNLPLNVGFAPQQAIGPLFAAGTSASYVMTREHPEVATDERPNVTQARLSLFPSDRLKRLIRGQRAVLYGAWAPGQAAGSVMKGHFLAWDGSRLLGDGAPAELSDVTLWGALILSPLAEAETAPTPAPIAGTELSDVFGRHDRVFLAFSGGKEAVTLAHMCEPWREKVTLLWVRVSHAAPHMAEFIRGYAAKGWRLEEIQAPHITQHWRAAGLPAEVVPVDNVTGRQEPRLQPWPSCCYALRQVPLNSYIIAQGERCALIHGQRDDDKGATTGGLQGQLPPHVEVVLPLKDWSEADVYAYITEHGLSLPEQYAQGYRDSLECLPCPASVNPERLAYLTKRYPIAASIARKQAAATIGVTGRALGSIYDTIMASAASLTEEPS